MEPEQLRQLLNTAHERQNVEVKAAGPYDRKTGFTGRVVKAIIGLSNLRDGGTLVLGVNEVADGELVLTGLSDQDLATWDTERLATLVNNYADPSVQFTLWKVELDSHSYVVVQVDPFWETPTLCKKSWMVAGDAVLRQGALYVRSRRKPETAELTTSEDMRALLQLAVEKRLADYVGTADRAGVGLSRLDETEARQEQDTAKYVDELGALDEF